ncbi:hypothetical protein [Shewanella baltica]|uniref:hypothetical protein n=1 Tax=Shewanella baltica TaxID=62322 RepID=UPI00325D5D02
MKWTEPWGISIKHQKNLNLVSRPVLLSCLKWTVGLFILALVSLAARDNVIQAVIQVLWVAPTFGFGLGWIIYIITWLSPVKISSGPNGIVREKGGSLVLIPWNHITSYQIVGLEGLNKLSLKLLDNSEHYFFIPEKVDPFTIKNEIESNLGSM